MSVRHNDKFSGWYRRAVIAIFVTLAIYLLTYPADPHPYTDGAIERWELHRDAVGRVQFLGISVGETRLIDTRNRLQTAPEVGLMISAVNGAPRRQLEAYYRDVEGGELILTLEDSAKLIERIEAARFNPYEYDSGTQRLSVPVHLLHSVGQLTVTGVTFITDDNYPIETLRARYGPARQYRREASGERHWVFHRWGMDVTQAPGAPTVIQVVDPRDLARLTAPLGADTVAEVP
jgi:hypothetical protein